MFYTVEYIEPDSSDSFTVSQVLYQLNVSYDFQRPL